jgi:hypothetical protein
LSARRQRAGATSLFRSVANPTFELFAAEQSTAAPRRMIVSINHHRTRKVPLMTDEIDDVEGHKNKKLQDDVEGHHVGHGVAEDDVEGHKQSKPRIADEDDVEGHKQSKPRIADEEGHRIISHLNDDPEHLKR